MTDSYETIIETLEQLRREVCAYDHPSLEKPPPTCDCKYANLGTAGKPLHTSEATGCPELRAAIEALRLLQAFQRAGFTVIQTPGRNDAHAEGADNGV